MEKTTAGGEQSNFAAAAAAAAAAWQCLPYKRGWTLQHL